MTQSANPPAAPQPGTPEYNAAMVAALESNNAVSTVPDPVPREESQPTKRPDDVPEKFWDAEKGAVNVQALLKSYTEAEQKLSGGKPAEQPPEAKEQPKAGLTVPDEAQLQNYAAEVIDSGSLSDASRDSLKKAGFTDALIDQLTAGVSAQRQLLEAKLHTAAGSKENFNRLVAWGKENLPPHERSLIDDQLNGSGYSAALDLLKLRYEKATGFDPTPISGGAPSAVSGAFASQAEMMAAISDPKYRADPAYRAVVARRIAQSSF